MAKGQPVPEPMPVRLTEFENRYGLLHPMKQASAAGCGMVQLGFDGPFYEFDLNDLEPVTRDEFEAWLYSR